MSLPSPTPNISTPASSSDLTFGVEIELLLLFHEELLLPHLPGGAEILKPPYPADAATIAPRFHSGPYNAMPYQSWCLRNAGHDSRSREFGRDFRGYDTEVLEIVQKLLLEQGPQEGKTGLSAVVMSDPKTARDFSVWSITNDASLRGLSCNDKIELLLKLGISATDADMYDTFGIELPSRVYHFADTPTWQSEIGYVLETVRGAPLPYHHHHGFVTQRCGLHVHIGKPTPFTLKQLKTLSHLLVLYEKRINSLHPWHRSEEGCFSETWELHSNLDAFGIEPIVPDSPVSGEEVVLDDDDEVDPAWEMRRLAHETISATATTDSLVKLMCPSGKAHIVNLTYLLPKRQDAGFAPTIEFRQHAGCLDMEPVAWWVHFLGSLVNLCVSDDGCISVKQLMDDAMLDTHGQGDLDQLWDAIGFVEQGRMHFRRKMYEYRNRV